MDFTIGQQTLSVALNNLVRNTNDDFEAYRFVQIEVIDENKIKLSAQNEINKLEYILEARNAKGETILLNARRFTDIINKLQDVITFHDNIIMCGKTKIRIDYSNETIIKPIITEEEHSKINIGNFKSVIKNRLYAVQDKKISGILSNLFVNGDEICAVNGNVLSLGKLETKVYKNFLLSQNLAKEILTDFKDDETVNITVDDGKKVIIWNDVLKIESRLQTGEFPKYNQLIPQISSEKIKIKINKNELIKKLEIMSIVVEYLKPQIKLVFNKNELTLEHREGKTVLDIENYKEDEPFEIYFNLHYLLSALKSTNSDIIELILGEDALRPIIIKGGNDLHLIMPVQVR